MGCDEILVHGWDPMRGLHGDLDVLPDLAELVLFEMAIGRNPTGHMGTPADVAAPVVFLASPLASWISGTNLVSTER